MYSSSTYRHLALHTPFFFSGPSFAHFGPPTGKSALGQHMLFRAGTCSHTKTWFFHLPWPWPRGRRTGLLPICSPSPSYLQIYIHPTAASVVKGLTYCISHTGELPGPANSYYLRVSHLGVICSVLLFYMMSLNLAILMCSYICSS
jgi:hypothetical protein